MARPRQITDEQILEAARRCFLEHGPSVSTTVIAEALGISHGVLFQRFGTKEELLKSALLPGEPGFIAELGAGPDARPIREQLLVLARRIYGYFEETVPRMTLLRASGLPAKDLCAPGLGAVPAPVRAHRALTGWLGRALEARRVRPHNPEYVSYVMLGALQARAFVRHVSGDPVVADDDSEYVATVIDLVCNSLEPDPRETQ